MGRIAFYLKARNKYKIHSPLLYSFTNEVVEDQDIYYADVDIKKLHELILVNHPHWKSSVLKQEIYSTLFRISKWFQPQQINIKGDQDGGLSAIALHYGARNANLRIQIVNPDMEEWMRKHFKLFNIPNTAFQFVKEGDNSTSNYHQKALSLMNASEMDFKKLTKIHDELSNTQSGTCLI